MIIDHVSFFSQFLLCLKPSHAIGQSPIHQDPSYAVREDLIMEVVTVPRPKGNRGQPLVNE